MGERRWGVGGWGERRQQGTGEGLSAGGPDGRYSDFNPWPLAFARDKPDPGPSTLSKDMQREVGVHGGWSCRASSSQGVTHPQGRTLGPACSPVWLLHLSTTFSLPPPRNPQGPLWRPAPPSGHQGNRARGLCFCSS